MQDLLSLLAWGDTGWGDELAKGAGLTVLLALCTLPVGLTAGLVVALAKNSISPWQAVLGNLYTTVFRALPELLTILIIYFGLQTLLNHLAAALGYEGNIEVNGFVAGLIALGLVLAAFSSEVWLGALRSVSKGQREGAMALGVGRFHTFRLVIFPQMLRTALPGLGNNWMALLKDTSLVSVIAVGELAHTAMQIRSQSFRVLEMLTAMAAIYWVLGYPQAKIVDWIHRKYGVRE